MRAFVEGQARGLDRIAEAFDAGDSAGAESGSVHEQGVKLNAAVAGKETAPSGIESLVVFEDSDGGFDGFDGGGTVLEEGISDGQRVGYALLVGFDHVVGDGPCATVN